MSAEKPSLNALNTKCWFALELKSYSVLESAAYQAATRLCSGCISFCLKIWFYNNHWKCYCWKSISGAQYRVVWGSHETAALSEAFVLAPYKQDIALLCFCACIFTAPKKIKFSCKGWGTVWAAENLRPLNYKTLCLPMLFSVYCLKAVYILPYCLLKTQKPIAGSTVSISIPSKQGVNHL